jgi:membrane dipeptidase
MKYFDGHNDVLLKLLYSKNKNKIKDFFNGNDYCHIDFPKIKRSNFIGGFFAIFVSDIEPEDDFFSRMNQPSYDFGLPKKISQDFALSSTMQMIEILNQIIDNSNGEIILCKTGSEIRQSINQKKVSVILHIEGAEAIDKEFKSLDMLYNLGLRSIGLVWSRQNIFATGVPFSYPSSPDRGEGLTSLGKDLVRLCDRKNILIDLSHLNEKGFWDVAELSTQPLMATHSNSHFLTNHSRNLTNEQLKAIKNSNGIVGVNFATAFLRDDGQMKEDTDLNYILSHCEHLIKYLGENRVALGSDFDGAVVPKDIKDLAGMYNLKNFMKDKGYDDILIEKIFFKNWIDFLDNNLIK